MKLSLSMICKGELENLEKLWPYVEDHIDQWVVVVPPADEAIGFLNRCGATVIVKDFTQPIEPKYRKQMAEYGLDVDKDHKLFNFAAARNEALANCIGDYILWLDGDDTPIGLHNLKEFIENQPETDQFNAIYDYGRDEEDNRISDHIRERVVRNNNKFKWLGGKLGLIHETLLPIEPFNPVQMNFPEDVFVVKHNSDHMDESSMRNHIALLYEYLKTNGEDPRTTLYLGIEYFNRRMYDYCIKVLMEYVEVGGSEDDRFSAWLKMAEAYNMLGDVKSSRNMYLKAIDEMPHRPDAYLGLGESYHEAKEWAKSTEYLMTGLQKKLPQTKHAVDKVRYTFRPAGYMALNYLELGKPGLAAEWFLKTAKMNPKHPWVKQYAPLFMDAKDLDDYVKAFVKIGQISQKLYPDTLPKLAQAIPEELQDQEILMDFKWRYTTPKIWQDNTIVFFCSAAFEDWGPESLEKGCGGSEEAIIQLTKRLVTMGWDVTIYNNCIKEAIVDGVKWVRYEKFNPKDMFNIVVSWRNNLFLNYEIKAMKKIIDTHDVADPRFYPPEDMTDVQMFVKSQFHRECFPALPDDRFVIIPNGIDINQFPQGEEKVKHSLVWTSSYDRGLEPLLEMWPDVLEKVPDATLEAYYGWELYDTTPWGMKPSGQEWKAKMQKALKQKGITEHGRVGTEEIAKAYQTADVWAYPTSFPEIDCITATKAMAAGAVPIATDFAALKERNQGVVVKEGESFKVELVALLLDDERRENIRKKLDVSKFDWSEISKQWDKELKR